MELLIRSDAVGLTVRNIKPAKTTNETKDRKADLVIGDVTTPCIMVGTVRGSFSDLKDRVGVVTLMITDPLRDTAYTKKGFVKVLITTTPVQFSAYIHADHLRPFFAECGMAAVLNQPTPQP